MPRFHLFSSEHLGALVVIVVLCLAVTFWGRRVGEGRRWVRWTLVLLLVGYVASEYVVRFRLGVRDWTWYVPLNISDWMLLASVLAVATVRPLPFELAYYWGLALGLPTLLTPDLRQGFPSFAYFHFFWGHGGVLVSLAYLMAAEGMRPRPGSAARAFLAANGYLLTAGLFDWFTGANFGYLRRPPGRGTILDLMGPWPWYILALEGILLIVFLLLYLPWKRGGPASPPRRRRAVHPLRVPPRPPR